MQTLELLVNPTLDLGTLDLKGGRHSIFLVSRESIKANDRRVFLAAFLLEIGVDRVALNVKIPTGRRDSRLDVVAFFSDSLLIVAYSSPSAAQRNAMQLLRNRQVIQGDQERRDKAIHGLLAIEQDLDLAGDLETILSGWARAGTLSEILRWSIHDLFGEQKRR